MVIQRRAERFLRALQFSARFYGQEKFWLLLAYFNYLSIFILFRFFKLRTNLVTPRKEVSLHHARHKCP